MDDLEKKLQEAFGSDYRVIAIPTWALDSPALLEIWVNIEEFMHWVRVVGGNPELAKAKVQEIIQTTPTGYLEAMEIVKRKITLGETL